MNVQVKYTGTALPLANTTYNLFNTALAANGIPERFFALNDIARFVVDVKNSHAGTLKVYKSDDRGTNWNQIDEVSVSAAAATGTNTYDWLVEPYRDWKVDWANGGSNQTTFEIDMSMTDERSPAA